MNKKLRPFIATHPGELIKDELKERNLTQKELSEMTGIKPSVLSETIHGKRSVSLNVAIALEKALGIPAFLSAILICCVKSPENSVGLVCFKNNEL